jgi:hypothetical protein
VSCVFVRMTEVTHHSHLFSEFSRNWHNALLYGWIKLHCA